MSTQTIDPKVVQAQAAEVADLAELDDEEPTPPPVKEPELGSLADLARPDPDFTVNAGAFTIALNDVARAHGKSASLPVLTMVHVEANAALKQITVAATNLEVAITRTLPAHVNRSGVICLPQVLATVIAGVEDTQAVRISVNAQSLTAAVTARTLASTLKCLPGADFPLVSPYANGAVKVAELELDADQLQAISKRVLPFTDTSDARPVLSGIHITADAPKHKPDGETTVKLEGADSFRLAQLTVKSVPCEFFLGDQTPKSWRHALDVIVPARFFTETLRLIAALDAARASDTEESETVTPDSDLFTLAFFAHLPKAEKGKGKKGDATQPEPEPVSAEGFAMMTTLEGTVLYNLIDGTYPDLTSILKAPAGLKTIPLPLATLGALKTAEQFADNKTVRLKCNVPKQRVVVGANSLEHGDYAATVAVLFGEDAPADKFEIAFNVRYLADIIKAVAFGDGETPVPMQVTEPSKPMFMNARGFRTVLMPMSINAVNDTAAENESSDPDPDTVQAAKAEQVVEGNVASAQVFTVVCPCNAKVAVIAGSTEICGNCGCILDDQGIVVQESA